VQIVFHLKTKKNLKTSTSCSNVVDAQMQCCSYGCQLALLQPQKPDRVAELKGV